MLKNINQRPQARVIDLGYPEWLNRVLSSRGVTSSDDINYKLNGLIPYQEMLHLEAAGEFVANAILKKKKIVILADYDCDGATACAVMIRGLTMLGAYKPEFVVPSRFEDGYGLSVSIVEKLSALFPDLDVLVTVDSGISNTEGAERFYQLNPNADLVITDHHLAPETLPRARYIVNPNQKQCEFPSKSIAGCGVAFYMLWAIKRALKNTAATLQDLLPIVALGTVCDVVPLDKNNRILVSAGLNMIRRGMMPPGIAAMIDYLGINTESADGAVFGFGLGPRVNAAGRLSDMTIGIRMLISENYEEAKRYAADLDTKNASRKEIETNITNQALTEIGATPKNIGLTVYNPDWHEGVIGIVASRIKERFSRPVICFTDSEQGEIKGSGRSVPGIHIRDILSDINACHPGLISKFGGHAMAAGLSMPKEHYSQFKDEFDAFVIKALQGRNLDCAVLSDGCIPAKDMTVDTVEFLSKLTPWGQAFEPPVFDCRFKVDGFKVLKEKHLQLDLSRDGFRFKGIYFNCLDAGDDPAWIYQKSINVAFELMVNEFRSRKNVQLNVKAIQA